MATKTKKKPSAKIERAGLRLEWMDPATLQANPKNWRRHPEPQKLALGAALKEVGWAGALLFNERTGNLIDGHARKEITPAGEKVPVLVGSWSDEQEAMILASLDPLAAMAEADQAALDALLATVHVDDPALEAMLAELKTQTPPVITEDEAPIDQAAELQKKYGTARGQLWEIPSKTVVGKSHRLLCGDSTCAEDVARVMGDERATLIVTSPPYNQGLDRFRASGMHKETRWADNAREGSYPDSRAEDEYQAEQVAAIKTWATVLTKTASIFYNHKNRFRDKECVSPWRWLEETGVKIRQEIIWHREGSVTQNARMFMPCDERIFWLYFGKDFYFADTTEIKTWSSVWKINSHKDVELSSHGCAFPVELAARPIQACSRPAEIVLEPYCGSGTTLVAAEQLSRLCYAIEIEQKYVAVALERLARLGLEPRLRD